VRKVTGHDLSSKNRALRVGLVVVMRIVIAGGSGFIGRHLISALVADGHAVTVLTRAQPVQSVTPGGLLWYVHWDSLTSDGGLADVLAGTDAVVNLAGANIGSRRWTTKRKADLLDSRVRATETLVRAIDRLDTSCRPRTLVNATSTATTVTRSSRKVPHRGTRFSHGCANDGSTQQQQPKHSGCAWS
jgi:NAD dependent epimerase/dehydratase family enzyme